MYSCCSLLLRVIVIVLLCYFLGLFIVYGCRYRGLQPVSDQDILKSYGGRHVRMEDISGFYGIVRARILQCNLAENKFS